MGIGDIRYTVQQVVNEVQRKLSLSQTTLSNNSQSIMMVDMINDVCNDLADFGEWQETLVTANIAAVSGQQDYSIQTSANVENIKDMFFQGNRSVMRNLSIDEMRIMTRVTVNGSPTQYTIIGTDTNGNPNIRVRPRPGANESGQNFSILYYIRAPLYTTSDGSTVIPYPGRIVVLGTLARMLLNESSGAPDPKYTQMQQDYLMARKEALNRFNGDTGWNTSFSPSLVQRRRR